MIFNGKEVVQIGQEVYQTITALFPNRGVSVEELRLQHYDQNQASSSLPCSAFGLGTWVRGSLEATRSQQAKSSEVPPISTEKVEANETA